MRPATDSRSTGPGQGAGRQAEPTELQPDSAFCLGGSPPLGGGPAGTSLRQGHGVQRPRLQGPEPEAQGPGWGPQVSLSEGAFCVCKERLPRPSKEWRKGYWVPTPSKGHAPGSISSGRDPEGQALGIRTRSRVKATPCATGARGASLPAGQSQAPRRSCFSFPKPDQPGQADRGRP